MDKILNIIENLIDDLERDTDLTKTEILEDLYKIKQEAEDYQLNQEEDLDY
jgi:hypothetical protein|tara:strand:- start:441 stop:593 length:153 start_codon:yes stop_codon:yes gene_type:complete